jgi:hypothetical protein
MNAAQTIYPGIIRDTGGDRFLRGESSAAAERDLFNITTGG